MSERRGSSFVTQLVFAANWSFEHSVPEGETIFCAAVIVSERQDLTGASRHTGKTWFATAA